MFVTNRRVSDGEDIFPRGGNREEQEGIDSRILLTDWLSTMHTVPLALEKGAAGRAADRTLGTAVPGAAAALAGTGHCSAGPWAGTGHSPVPSAGH